eukprot:CAMPEP_0178916702 /NCGR_PEP_ID=MMETSP0786-20121207/12805_1 /TAXON_ID=186022 /ORGANISM="Thalassionema frauenfeldii, Strain CCMP 1798" /LENGTH=420 /DNA_ID=CAMNT_0020590105 /DNA_START=8 /DNA_END=1273 /DNA_ORIENTATION=-
MDRNRILSPSYFILTLCLLGYMTWQDTSTLRNVSTRSNSFWCANAISLSFRSKETDEEDEEEDEQEEYERNADAAADDEFSISFRNKSQKNVHVNWIHPNDAEHEAKVIDNLAPGSTETVQSLPGHWFAAYDEERSFRVVADEPGKIITIRKADTVPHHRPVRVEFTNKASKALHINWIDLNTQKEQTVVENLMPGTSSGFLDSFTDHHFIVFDNERTARVELKIDTGHAHGDLATFTITDDTIGPPKVVFWNVLGNDSSDNEPTEAVDVRVSWIGPDEVEQPVIANLHPGHQSKPIDTFHGHRFVAYDDEETFRTEFLVSRHHGTEVFQIKGHDGVARTMAKFVNSHPDTIHVNYIDERTNEEHPVIRNLNNGEASEVVTSHRGHRFVAFNDARTFRKIFTHEGPLGMVESHTISSDEL